MTSAAPPFADDAGVAVGQVKILDVQRQQLACAGRGLVEHPPQRSIALKLRESHPPRGSDSLVADRVTA
jgi:hypothetical protein